MYVCILVYIFPYPTFVTLSLSSRSLSRFVTVEIFELFQYLPKGICCIALSPQPFFFLAHPHMHTFRFSSIRKMFAFIFSIFTNFSINCELFFRPLLEASNVYRCCVCMPSINLHAVGLRWKIDKTCWHLLRNISTPTLYTYMCVWLRLCA